MCANAMFLGMYPSCTMCATWHVVGLCVLCAPAPFVGMCPSCCARAPLRVVHALVCALPVHRLVSVNVYGRWTKFHVDVVGDVPSCHV